MKNTCFALLCRSKSNGFGVYEVLGFSMILYTLSTVDKIDGGFKGRTHINIYISVRENMVLEKHGLPWWLSGIRIYLQMQET